MPKVLFICKKRQTEYGVSYGLINSCKFLCNALSTLNIESKVVSVIDNNCIDREVHQYKPTHVFIEALWVVPEKMKILSKLHPTVRWYIRIHSNTPFLANEGIAIEWINAYNDLRMNGLQVYIACNSRKLINDLWQSKSIGLIYAPNIYKPEQVSPTSYTKTPIIHTEDILNIGCFGSIRPMKNHLLQAMAAMTFANSIGKNLHFHINNRCEQNGESIYKNLFNLFKNTSHQLIVHDWMTHSEFLGLIKEMDLGMQVSFSETFNIVAADMVSMNIPIVGSGEINWLSYLYQARPTNLTNIILHLELAYKGRIINLQWLNKYGLSSYNKISLYEWKDLIFF